MSSAVAKVADRASAQTLLDRASFAGLVCALVWAPLPLASNRPWSLAALAVLVWAALMFCAAGHAIGGRSQRRLRGAAWPLALGTGFCALVAVQVGWGGVDSSPLASLDAFQNRAYLLRALTYTGAIALTVLVVDTRQRCLWLLGAVVAAGLVQAALAVVLYSTGASYDFLFTDFEQGGRATGTFVNPDHLAGYMELCLSAGLGLMLAQFSADAASPRGWRGRVLEGLTFLMSAKMLLRLGLVVLVVALVMSHSRMGNGAFFISLLLVGALVAFRSAKLRRPALWLVGSMAVVDIFIIGQWVGLERVVERLQSTAEASSKGFATFGLQGLPPPPREESLAQRMEIPRQSLKLVEQRPWFGYGGGSYAIAFQPVKPATVYAGFWDHAHNDYVQVAADTGLVGLALWFGIGLATAFKALPLLRDGQPRLNRGVGVAGLMALSCFGLHSMVDFNLHIPANALTFVVLLGLVWVVALLPPENKALLHADAE